MEETVFVRLSESRSTGYISVEKVFFDEQKIEEEYYGIIEEMGISNPMSLKDWKDKYHKVKVSYDGRKSHISYERIKEALVEKDVLEKAGQGGLMGAYYRFKK